MHPLHPMATPMADLESLDQGFNSYNVSYFNYYMTYFNTIFTKMIDTRQAIKLVHQLSLEK